jgi:hypothetical protein
VPEIAEREPKVISVGITHVGASYLGFLVWFLPSPGCHCSEDSLRSG